MRRHGGNESTSVWELAPGLLPPYAGSGSTSRRDCIIFAHQNLESRAGPRKVFTHSSRSVSLDDCLNAGFFQRALGQLRLGAATARPHDNKLGVLHSTIISWIRATRFDVRSA